MKKTVGFIEIHRKRYGGVRYGDMAKEALKKEYAVDLVIKEARLFLGARYLRIPESLVRLLFLKEKRDVWVRDIFSILTIGFDRTKGKNLAVIYHHDFSGFPAFARPFFTLFHRPLFFWGLGKADAIVVIAKFWEKYFAKKGYKNIFLIYMGFDLKEYETSKEEVLAFQEKYGLVDKPIVYLGNCQKAKGVVEAYEELKGLNAHLVTSGARQVNIPARNLDLSQREYFALLKASSVVLAMSRFKEGWCITAHEAMLMGTPVIGSGRGGMRELLEGGGQIVLEDIGKLREMVEGLLKNPHERAKLGEAGYNFARQFSQERFERSWLAAMGSIV